MDLKLDSNGLIPAIAQDVNTGQVLTLGYCSPGALERTLKGPDVWFYSRSRDTLWHKGEVSGNFLKLKTSWVDCDGDTILFQVDPTGPSCHTGKPTCFSVPITSEPTFQRQDRGSGVLEELFAIIRDRQRTMPEGSYTASLFSQGTGRIAQKVIEEAGEAALAATQGQQEQLSAEAADLLYHLLTLLAASDVMPEAVWKELRARRNNVSSASKPEP